MTRKGYLSLKFPQRTKIIIGLFYPLNDFLNFNLLEIREEEKNLSLLHFMI